MDKDWAPEPLTHDGVWFVDANGHQLGGQNVHELGEATINRILACYNACAGVPTRALEEHTFEQVAKACDIMAELFTDPLPLLKEEEPCHYAMRVYANEASQRTAKHIAELIRGKFNLYVTYPNAYEGASPEQMKWIYEHYGIKEATDGHDNIGPTAHDNFRWFPDPEDL